MNHELLWVLGLLAVVVTLFILNRPRMDVVALMVILALPLSLSKATNAPAAGDR